MMLVFPEPLGPTNILSPSLIGIENEDSDLNPSTVISVIIKVGGIDGIALTKLDVLDGLESLKVCTSYRYRGETLSYFPAGSEAQAGVEPVYETLDGWSDSTFGARSWADLPATAIKYVRRIEELIEAPVALLSTSPERDDTILVRDPFAG